MLTVRYPNGIAVRFNTATWVVSSDNNYHDIYTAKNGTWLSRFPIACGIETITPCAVIVPSESLDSAIATVRAACRERTHNSRGQLAELKRELEALNRQTLRWRD